jgi:uncharacterized membrane protein YgcG
VVAGAASEEEAQVAAGELGRLNHREQLLVEKAVDRAEQRTGMQFCVYLGTIDDADPRAEAEAIFVRSGLHARPAVLLVVDPKHHRIEIVTGDRARRRIPDTEASAAVDAMGQAFRDGDLAGGVVAGLERLAAAAGFAESLPEDVELPDVIRRG